MTKPLCDQIGSSAGLSSDVEAVGDLMPSAKDEEVLRYAKDHDRIVVTTEKRMTEKQFPICTHPGIIVLSGGRRHESIHAGLFKRFMHSGRRAEARHAVTYLTESQARIISEGSEVTFAI